MSSVAPLPASTSLTVVPDNVENLPKEEVVRLLKRVASERNALDEETKQKKSKSSHPNPSAAETVVSPAAAAAAYAKPPVITAVDIEKIKKRIKATMNRVVKKTVHKDKTKPWTEFAESLPNEEVARALFGDFNPSSDSKKLLKWNLDGQACEEIFGQVYVHPVKYEGLVICLRGVKPRIHAWARFVQMQAKFTKSTGLLELRVRTLYAGSGFPDGRDVPPSRYY